MMNASLLLCLAVALLAPLEQVKPVHKIQAPAAGLTANLLAGTKKPEAKKCPQIAADGSTQFVDCDKRVKPRPSNTHADVSVGGGHDQEQTSGSLGARVTTDADSPLGKKFIEAQTASLDYQIEALNHRRSVFRWQHTSSVIIFWLVTALVLAGLALAALQFWEASKAQQAHTEIAAQNARAMAAVAVENARTLGEAKADALKIAAAAAPGAAPAGPVSPATPEPPKSDKKDDATSFELSLSGIKISSSVIGLIVLAMSIGFFYLYLKYVYPVQDIGQKAPTEQTQKNTDQSDKK